MRYLAEINYSRRYPVTELSCDYIRSCLLAPPINFGLGVLSSWRHIMKNVGCRLLR